MSTEKKISPPDRQKLVSADKQRETLMTDLYLGDSQSNISPGWSL